MSPNLRRVLLVAPEPADAGWRGAVGAARRSAEAALAAAGFEVRVLAPATAVAFEERLQAERFGALYLIVCGRSRAAARYGTIVLEGSDGRARDLNVQNLARLCRASGAALVVLQPAPGSDADLTVARDSIVAQGLSVQLTSGHVDAAALASLVPEGDATGVATAARSAAAQNAGVESAPATHVMATSPAPAPTVSPAEEALARKRAACAFDVFLCHNVDDKPAVAAIGRRLMERGILPWLDQWELRPGMPWQRLLEQQISRIAAAAVFVGGSGIGPWQRQELEGFLGEFVRRGCPVIPVMLPGASGEPQLPIFLRGMTWVDFRATDPDPLAQLVWGVTGERPIIR